MAEFFWGTLHLARLVQEELAEQVANRHREALENRKAGAVVGRRHWRLGRF